MLSLTHASAGALAGEFIPNPYLAFIVGVILHLIMDKIPHLWPTDKFHQNVMIMIDVVLSIFFLVGLYIFPETRNLSMIAGALGGLSVDFFFVIVMQQRGKWAEWHTNRQPHKAQLYWIMSDAIIFGALVSLIVLTRF